MFITCPSQGAGSELLGAWALMLDRVGFFPRRMFSRAPRGRPAPPSASRSPFSSQWKPGLDGLAVGQVKTSIPRLACHWGWPSFSVAAHPRVASHVTQIDPLLAQFQT